ncbi:SAM-dependent methyltransferase [Arthrobacter sp. MYb229]|uniref:class I SAM-dependent methyltransferase n=1 Tax=unclassified Arthrobacter TaxID=235627 RepID=UPI000CFBC2A6|nr:MULTISPECIES: class I SAM-dependent methyltransferase [unclassified Arthrobacter]PRA02408.1 SAM-dependent methyltransferase [Arthrobacter sp. MYb229]PRB50649.1 SAM-dependent methyltransferase [Arthrobacter sp. MYb216]
MDTATDLNAYAAKMRALTEEGTDLEVDVRFVDMLSSRAATILDIGCGIGNAVHGLRFRGHNAYGIDPTEAVLQVAAELHDPAWFRPISATEISVDNLVRAELPVAYDAILLSGNVPAFLSPAEFSTCFALLGELLRPQGALILGTTSALRGGPKDQDEASKTTELLLTHRYADWHLNPFSDDSPWSVSVFARTETREFPQTPDGKFILGR